MPVLTGAQPRQRGPARPPGPKLARPTTVRLPALVGAAVGRLAAAEGLTAGAWMRRAVCTAAGEEPDQAVPVRRYRTARPVPSLDRLAVAQLREAVGEAVGTLRQVAGLDRARGGSRLAELDTAIDRLLAEVPRLDALKESTP